MFNAILFWFIMDKSLNLIVFQSCMRIIFVPLLKKLADVWAANNVIGYRCSTSKQEMKLGGIQ